MAVTTLSQRLWFDVGVKRYTTGFSYLRNPYSLWFDVGVKRYTTEEIKDILHDSCGLM